jgi:hypothetical protein
MNLMALIHHPRAKSIVAEAGLAVFLFFSDPLGITSQKSHVIDNAIATLTQYHYQASDKLAVILIDKKTLNGWKVDWPITYEKIAELIHALACAKAIGVFFDFTASKEFDLAAGQDQLEAAIENSATFGPDCRDEQQHRDGQQQRQRPRRIEVFFGKADDIDTPLANKIDHRSFWIDTGSLDGIYPAGRVEFPELPLKDSEVTPAFGIVRNRTIALIGSATDRDPGEVCHVDDPRPKCWVKPIALRWSGLVDGKQSNISRTEGCRGWTRWTLMVSNIVGLTRQNKYEICPPILTLRADDLYRDRNYIAANGNPATIIEGRFVFVGVDLAGLNDQVFSPVHGYLPGVYKHAMATDNLISYSSRYPTIPEPWVLGIAVVIIYSLIETAKELSRGAKGSHLIVAFLIFGFILGFTWITYCYKWPFSLIFAVFGYYLGSIFFVGAASGRSLKAKKPSDATKDRRR